MSRHAAATSAGRARTIQRPPAPAKPRRVSGPAVPNRRDAEGSRGEDGRESRAGRSGGEQPRAGAEGSRGEDGRASRAGRSGGEQPRAGAERSGGGQPRAGAERSGGQSRAGAARSGGGHTRAAAAAARGPRPGIALTALAYADAALAPRARMRPAPRTLLVAPRPQRLAYGGVAIASRVAGVALDVSASRAMDRLVRSRVWIGIIACGLIGLVAMQVSMLKLNSGIGRAVQTASTLERSNATLRAEISTLGAGDRIQHLAESAGMVMPAPADVTYLRAGGAHDDAVRAVRHMRAPDPALLAAPAGAPTLTATPPASATPGASTPATIAAGTTPASTAPSSTAPVTTASTGTAAPTAGATVPAATTPGTTAAPPTTAATATAAPTGASSGGAAPPQATAATP